VLAAASPSANEFSIEIRTPAPDASPVVKKLFQAVTAALLRRGTNMARGRRLGFRALLIALGGDARKRAGPTTPISVEYLRNITTTDANNTRLVAFTPPLKLCDAKEKSFVDDRTKQPYALHIAVRYPTASDDGTLTFAAIREAHSASEALRTFMNISSAATSGYAHLRFRLDYMDSVDALRTDLQRTGIPMSQCEIVNADTECEARSGSTLYAPILAVPLHLVNGTRDTLRNDRVDQLVQPVSFCAGCGIVGASTRACRECTDADKANPICFQCQRRKNDHAPSDYDVRRRCTIQNVEPCMLCSANHEPFRCSRFNAHWEPCFPQDRKPNSRSPSPVRPQSPLPAPTTPPASQRRVHFHDQQQQQRRASQQRSNATADGGLVALSQPQRHTYADAVAANAAPRSAITRARQRTTPEAPAAANESDIVRALRTELKSLREAYAKMSLFMDGMRNHFFPGGFPMAPQQQPPPVQQRQPLSTPVYEVVEDDDPRYSDRSNNDDRNEPGYADGMETDDASSFRPAYQQNARRRSKERRSNVKKPRLSSAQRSPQEAATTSLNGGRQESRRPQYDD